MIRFVEITGIYLDDKKSFGFYNTVKDSFVNLNGAVVFDDLEDFDEMYCESCGFEYERLRSLIPEKWI